MDPSKPEAESLRPEIAASWARSSLSGVDGDRLSPGPAVGADPAGRIALIAGPVLDRLASTLADTRTTVVLTDAHAGVLARRAGTRVLGNLLDDVGLVPGWSYAEEFVGTNGMGTAAEDRRPVRVVGDEHYAEALRGLTCVGVPIEHPVTGRLEGVLDLTCFNEDAGPWMSALVAEAVAGVRGLLEEHATVAERALFGAFLRASNRGTGAVVSLNGSFVLTNPAAARLLEGVDHGVLWEAGAEAVRSGQPLVQDLRLPGGAQVRAAFEVVEVGSHPVGTVVRLTEDSTGTARPGRSCRDSPMTTTDRGAGSPESVRGAGGGSNSGLTARLAAEIASAVELGERVLVRGPSGAGKLTLAHLAVGNAVTFDAGRAMIDGSRVWLMGIEAALGHGGPVVLRHLDDLAPDVAGGLAAVLDSAVDGTALVATVTEIASGATGPGGPAQALLDRFECVVRVPRLTDRAGELPGLVRSMVARLAPNGAIKVGPEVVQALGRVEWAGNLRQLESVLHRIVVRRRSGVVTLDDLPPEIRAATHRPYLTAMEQRECQAIADALAAAEGNKLAAAQALGISRSTLYRKLDAYGLQLDQRTW